MIMTNDHSNDLLDDAMSSYLFQQRKIDEVITIVQGIKEFITDYATDDEWDNEDLKHIHGQIKSARNLLREIDRLYPAPEGEQ